MARKKRAERGVTTKEVLSKYPVETYHNPNTEEDEKRVLVKANEFAEALTDAQWRKKRSLIQRVFGLSRPIAKFQTSVADDEGTTEIGGTGAASTPGLFSDEYYDQIKIDNTRFARYTDYIHMDAECVELSRAREITVSNVFSSRDGDNESYKLTSKVPRVQAILDGVDERTKMQDEIPGMCDSMLQFGDDFEEVVVDTRMLITRLKWLNPTHMYRNEDEFGRLQAKNAFTLKKSGGKVVNTFDFWMVRHLRHSHKRGSMYGRSFYFTARKPWRYLRTMEDGVMMTRINRADDHLVFSLVGPKNASPRKLKRLVEEAKSELKRRTIIDSSTGQLDKRHKPMPDGNDFYLMKSRDPNAVQPDIKRLEATGNLGQLGDVEYFQNKTMMSTPVPKSYLGLERDVNAKSTLTNQDIEFGRQLRHIQKEMAAFQRSVYDFQLVLLGITPMKDLYTIEYPPISFIAEEMKMTVESLKWEIATIAKTSLRMPTRWLLEHIIGLSEDDIEGVMVAIQAEPSQDIAVPTMPNGQPFTREHALRDNKLAADLSNIRDMIMDIRASRLTDPYEG